MFDAVGQAWVTLFKSQPTKRSIVIMLCQWVLETGWGKSCWCWNIGNFRSRDGDGRDWCLYECDERLPPAQANKYVANPPPRADDPSKPSAAIKSRNKDGTITVYFWPDNPMCRFRAFKTMEDGVLDYVTSLNKRFYKSWPAVVSGNPSEFVRLLKVQNYFTADEETYKKGVVALFNQLMKRFAAYEMPEYEEIRKDEARSDDGSDDMTDEYRDRVMGLVAVTLSQSIHGDEPDPQKNA